MEGFEMSTANGGLVDVPAFVNLLTTHLAFTHTPKGLAKAYHETAGAQEGESTERIFLDAGGFPAWFAYFLTKRAAKGATHFDGQAACHQMLEALDKVPSEDRKLLAREVAAAIPADTHAKFCDVFEKILKPNQVNIVTVPQKRPRVTEDGGRLAAATPSTDALTSGASMLAEQSSSRFNLGNPPVLRVSALFPTFLAGAIRRYSPTGGGSAWTAAITMSFPDVSSLGNKFGSMMSLEITSNKVERLASILFDVGIESTDEHRYLIQPTGLRVIPSPDLVLRGCRRDVILDVFGHDVETAIKASPAYREEAEQGNPLTECVSMTISHRAKDGAVINLSLDQKEGVRVRVKLYE
ncbi:hypothetical protein VTI74DRAFT_7491 [Chaetomium olivicolor]